MATVDDLLETLDGPVSEQLNAREGRRLHKSYNFAPLDVRQGEGNKHTPDEEEPVDNPAEESREGYDSEGKKKTLSR